LRLLEVRHVVAYPLALLVVPLEQPLALRPRPPLRVGGGVVVEDAAVRRPGPRPLERVQVLLPPRLAPRRLVPLVLVDAAVDPAAARRRPVGLQLGVGREGPVGCVPPVDLA